MIYVDSSVALAQLLFETRAPRASLWRESLVSSRLLEYELWNRVHAYRLTGTRGDDVRAILALVDMIEMTGPVLARTRTVSGFSPDAGWASSGDIGFSAPPCWRTRAAGEL